MIEFYFCTFYFFMFILMSNSNILPSCIKKTHGKKKQKYPKWSYILTYMLTFWSIKKDYFLFLLNFIKILICNLIIFSHDLLILSLYLSIIFILLVYLIFSKDSSLSSNPDRNLDNFRSFFSIFFSCKQFT